MERKLYKYYAILDFADDGISVTFPDLPGCITCGYTKDEAVQMAKEALMLYLEDMIEENIPQATQIKNSVLKPSEQAFLIEIQL
ncbi:type II toxin-antitoxin system HicB family antitoxin [Paenibacillus massiliensis]|uniref:type II toxin-antitoxin system HicB family antitoxin n=1 Tax=Paenibacillus massiliensis TaxID=225917 RepID=UPI0004712F2D|nr:type II toxin-antitoxin system HicB family antitoxin [Paenibacillus massiliensis]